MFRQWLPQTLCVSKYASPLSLPLQVAYHSYRRTDRCKDHEDEAHKAAHVVKSEEDSGYDASSEAASSESQLPTPMDVCVSEDDASSGLDDDSSSCVSLFLSIIGNVRSLFVIRWMSGFFRLSPRHPVSTKYPLIRLSARQALQLLTNISTTFMTWIASP